MVIFNFLPLVELKVMVYSDCSSSCCIVTMTVSGLMDQRAFSSSCNTWAGALTGIGPVAGQNQVSRARIMICCMTRNMTLLNIDISTNTYWNRMLVLLRHAYIKMPVLPQIFLQNLFCLLRRQDHKRHSHRCPEKSSYCL